MSKHALQKITFEYYRILKSLGIDINAICEQIKKILETGEWSWLNVQGLMDYGIINGICTKLGLDDHANGTELENNFLNISGIKTMKDIEYMEYELLYGTDEERLEQAEEEVKIFKDKQSSLAVFKKYEAIVKGKEITKTSGATRILEYMEKHGLTIQDLSLALAMAQATKTGVKEAEGHIIDEKTSQINPDREEPTQIG